MYTPICPGCGCSLIRLGISREKAVYFVYDSKDYYFCCRDCLSSFLDDPTTHIQRLEHTFVCPVCLGEKDVTEGVKLNADGAELFFCRCATCMRRFDGNREFYLRRYVGDYLEQEQSWYAACC